MCVCEIKKQRAFVFGSRTIQSRVEEVFPQVTAKHPLLQDASLLELLLGGTRLHEGPQEADQLAVLFRHCHRGATESRSVKGNGEEKSWLRRGMAVYRVY